MYCTRALKCSKEVLLIRGFHRREGEGQEKVEIGEFWNERNLRDGEWSNRWHWTL